MTRYSYYEARVLTRHGKLPSDLRNDLDGRAVDNEVSML
jgi:hypothetical protein